MTVVFDQDMAEVPNLAALVFHVTALAHHLVVSWYTMTYVDGSTASDPFVRQATTQYKWRFYSGWTFATQGLFLLLSLLDDVAVRRPAAREHPLRARLCAAKSFLFQAWVFPLSGSVTCMFWFLYAMDRELVFTRGFDEVVPNWVNHAVHTDTGIIIVTELLLVRHPWKHRATALQGLTLYLAAYDSCLLYTRLRDGVWLYPVYAVLPGWALRLLYLAAGNAMVYSLYFLAEAVGRRLNVRRATAGGASDIAGKKPLEAS